MNNVISILCKKYNYEREEAKNFLLGVISEINIALAHGGDPEEVEALWTMHTGLETDYLFQIL